MSLTFKYNDAHLCLNYLPTPKLQRIKVCKDGSWADWEFKMQQNPAHSAPTTVTYTDMIKISQYECKNTKTKHYYYCCLVLLGKLLYPTFNYGIPLHAGPDVKQHINA